MKKNINVFAVLSGNGPSVILPGTYITDGSDLVVKDILSRVESALNHNVEAEIEGVHYATSDGVINNATIKVSVTDLEDTAELKIWLFHVGAEWQKDFTAWEQYFRFRKEF